METNSKSASGLGRWLAIAKHVRTKRKKQTKQTNEQKKQNKTKQKNKTKNKNKQTKTEKNKKTFPKFHFGRFFQKFISGAFFKIGSWLAIAEHEKLPFFQIFLAQISKIFFRFLAGHGQNIFPAKISKNLRVWALGPFGTIGTN